MPENSVILLVEDRDDDVVLIRKAFEKAGLTNPFQVTRDGEEAIAYLSGEGKFSNRVEFPLPWLVLLDLKMPKVDGFEVLQWIRAQPTLSRLIVLVLTSSEYMKDVDLAYKQGANSFLVKPLDFENAVQMGELIRRYWIGFNRFPESDRPPRKKQGKVNGNHGS
jgi:CheY-like chemotaxis protein